MEEQLGEEVKKTIPEFEKIADGLTKVNVGSVFYVKSTKAYYTRGHSNAKKQKRRKIDKYYQL